MRSSIACARCRRSKVKCVNNGVGTTCRACETTGRECTYPVPISGAGGGARQGSGDSRQPGEAILQHDYLQAPRKPRLKKAAAPSSVSTKESMRALVDALDPSILTPQVWVDLFDIWSLHYSTDLPFIHPPSFLQTLRQVDRSSLSADPSYPQSSSSAFPPASPLTLLAFLALTARFHDKLVTHHSPPSASRPSNPLIACQYYAAACRARLAGSSGDGLGLPDIDRVQALAMLALHDWGNCAGQRAWVGLGVSIRYAQVLGLQYQADLDDEPESRSSTLSQRSDARPFMEDETKRRIFWGLFVMDRYLSSGKYRPQMLRNEDIRLQLPSSERSFLFKEKVQTSLLSGPLPERGPRQKNSPTSRNRSESSISIAGRSNQQMEDYNHPGRWEVGPDEGIVSRYIRAIDLYGGIIHWSCSGGRRRDRHPPWQSDATWNILNVKLNKLIEALPRDLTLSPANIHAHIVSKTSTQFMMMHTVLLLGRMMLHREYIPFIPLRSSKPEGPLDPPLFPPEKYQVPHGFWAYTASELFRTARSLVDLAHTCHEWKVLPQTPIVGFAIYIAAFAGVYAINFPWMDPDGYMSKKTSPDAASEDESGANAARHALSMVAFMKRRLRMADTWFKTINRVHRYYVRIKKDFQRNVRALGGPHAPPGPLSIREGGIGGGLAEFKMLEATLKEFGNLDDNDVEMMDAPEAGADRASSADAASTAGKSENPQEQDRPQESPLRFDSWKAINTATEAMPGTNGSPYTLPPLGSLSSSIPTHRPHPSSGSHISPQTSPASGQNQLPPFPPHQNQPQAGPQLTPLPMTAEQTEAWLQTLDTAFTGDDLSAFIEGTDWQAWSDQGERSTLSPGWLSTIWAGPPLS